jgi:RimJ/RimL family protein N-acetyltransferase
MASSLPTIETERLVLRPFADADARDVQRLAGDRLVAATTLLIPHPYEDGMAEAWIATHEAAWEAGHGLTLAITLRPAGELVGAIGLTLWIADGSGELGYWIGVPWWGRGYATEAARALVDCGFGRLGLQVIHAGHFAANPASGRVLEKVGMSVDGVQPRAICKWGTWHDLRLLSIRRQEWGQ